MTKSQMSKSKKDMMDTFKGVFKLNKFTKKLEFQEKGINENTILDRLKQW